MLLWTLLLNMQGEQASGITRFPCVNVDWFTVHMFDLLSIWDNIFYLHTVGFGL